MINVLTAQINKKSEDYYDLYRINYSEENKAKIKTMKASKRIIEEVK